MDKLQPQLFLTTPLFELHLVEPPLRHGKLEPHSITTPPLCNTGTHLHRSRYRIPLLINYEKQFTKLAAPRIPQYAPFATRPSAVER